MEEAQGARSLRVGVVWPFASARARALARLRCWPGAIFSAGINRIRLGEKKEKL